MLIVIIIVIVNLSGIRREFVVLCILNIMRTLAFCYLLFQECLLPDSDVGMQNPPTSTTLPRTPTEKRATGSDDALSLGVCLLLCVLVSDLAFAPSVLLSNSSHLLFLPWSWAAGRPGCGPYSCDQLFVPGQTTLQVSMSLSVIWD